MKVKLGCFGFVRDIDLIRTAGYDTAEMDIYEINSQSKDEFKKTCSVARASGLTFNAFSGFMPLTEHIYKDSFQFENWLLYAEKAAVRTAGLGCRIWPFGCGKPRSIPLGIDGEKAKAKFKFFVEEICHIIKKYGIVLAIEPLGSMNSNYLNYISETVKFVESVNLENCMTMCDFRHMVKLNEGFDEIVKYRDYICHAHIDNPCGMERRFPMAGDGVDYDGYLEALDRAGYDKILTVEATNYSNFEKEAKKTMEFFKLKGLK
ncbi:MAG: sugar phosphate isomerase/epimerase [Candidatus Atribacteria bacterium]|nr:sugar phosphate isomerase/epimerase [Candidatus Atribacteria bacterium]